MRLDFTVFGIGVPQGSMRAFMPKRGKFPVVKCDNSETMPWRQQVTMTALVERQRQHFDLVKRPDGVRVRLAFFFPKPKSVKFPDKTTKPDADKLQRAIFDALSGVVFEDDAQVVAVSCTKHFGSPARMDVRIETLDDAVREAVA